MNTAACFSDLYTDRRLTRTHLHAVIAIAVLNGLDLVTTKLALDRGATEGNPVAAFMLDYPGLLVASKIVLCAGLLLGAVVHREITPRLLAAAWFVTGVYSLVVVLNTIHVFT